jgi:hypothetical protein
MHRVDTLLMMDRLSKYVGYGVRRFHQFAALADRAPLTSRDSESPFRAVHRTEDSLSAYAGEILALALRSAGVDAAFHTGEGAGHGGGAEFDAPALMDLVADFPDRELRGPNASALK